jgi:hypothetical protein
MNSLSKGAALISSASTGVGAVHHADRLGHGGFDLRRQQLAGLPEVTMLNRADQPLVVTATRPARILLVDAALALHESHLMLLRSIPAIVEILASCADLYLHQEHGYWLVILVLHPQSRETAEAAHFVRRRWSGARILLLESESAMIDDWLYDERVDPHLHPDTLREAAIRLMTGDKYRIQA